MYYIIDQDTKQVHGTCDTEQQAMSVVDIVNEACHIMGGSSTQYTYCSALEYDIEHGLDSIFLHEEDDYYEYGAPKRRGVMRHELVYRGINTNQDK